MGGGGYLITSSVKHYVRFLCYRRIRLPERELRMVFGVFLCFVQSKLVYWLQGQMFAVKLTILQIVNSDTVSFLTQGHGQTLFLLWFC